MTIVRTTSTFSPIVRAHLATDRNSDAPVHVLIHDAPACKPALMETPWLCCNGHGSMPPGRGSISPWSIVWYDDILCRRQNPGIVPTNSYVERNVPSKKYLSTQSTWVKFTISRYPDINNSSECVRNVGGHWTAAAQDHAEPISPLSRWLGDKKHGVSIRVCTTNW